MSAVTDWFEGDVLPVHEGVYEREISAGSTWQAGQVAYWLWDGKHWRAGGYGNAQYAADFSTSKPAPEQNLPWRGLASNPAAKRGGK